MFSKNHPNKQDDSDGSDSDRPGNNEPPKDVRNDEKSHSDDESGLQNEAASFPEASSSQERSPNRERMDRNLVSEVAENLCSSFPAEIPTNKVYAFADLQKAVQITMKFLGDAIQLAKSTINYLRTNAVQKQIQLQIDQLNATPEDDSYYEKTDSKQININNASDSNSKRSISPILEFPVAGSSYDPSVTIDSLLAEAINDTSPISRNPDYPSRVSPLSIRSLLKSWTTPNFRDPRNP